MKTIIIITGLLLINNSIRSQSCTKWIGEPYNNIPEIIQKIHSVLLFDYILQGSEKDSLSEYYQFDDAKHTKLSQVTIYCDIKNRIEGTETKKYNNGINSIQVTGPFDRIETLYNWFIEQVQGCNGFEKGSTYALFSNYRIYINKPLSEGSLGEMTITTAQ